MRNLLFILQPVGLRLALEVEGGRLLSFSKTKTRFGVGMGAWAFYQVRKGFSVSLALPCTTPGRTFLMWTLMSLVSLHCSTSHHVLAHLLPCKGLKQEEAVKSY
ncbi:hypothetical protein IRJ41_012451 [Triplophysa rosa]|uniref:Uncharacterized protein n=1 Tax=Triplophysa rosa TaxID=992332 RepID=A0A9W7TGU6_TRIRA|nr:hypothetical protein IRJ41_012451 [Triplophysa rosa]